MKYRYLIFWMIALLLSGITSGAPASRAEEEQPVLPAKGYVLISTATQAGWLMLPDEGDVLYPLTQTFPDGTETLNLIHLTPEGVYVEDASCENHDCVGQGIVTLENRNSRILGNMIVCLPNQVLLQLFSPEEVQEMVRQGMPAPAAEETPEDEAG